MMSKSALRQAAFALLALGVVSDAAAQFGGSRRATGSLGRDSALPREARPAQDGEVISYEVVEYRLNLFAEALRPTAAQAPLWDEFQKKVRLYAADVARQRAAARTAPVSVAAAHPGAQKHLAQAVDDARNRLASLEDVEAAMIALMQVLTPEQRELADARIPTIVAPRPVVAGAEASLQKAAAPTR